jgi:lipoate-protein ligase A
VTPQTAQPTATPAAAGPAVTDGPAIAGAPAATGVRAPISAPPAPAAAGAPGSARRRSAPPPLLRWRLLHDGRASGARNMAVDHALADCLAGGEAVLRLYRWERPTLSLGRNEPAALYPMEAIRSKGMDVVRRPTGGRAVLHDAELTYAVVAPIGTWAPRAAYRVINEALAAALRSLGAPVAVSEGSVHALGPDAGPCFRSPAAGEVVASGRKLVGSAQARIGGALLQHGSILLGGSQRALGDETAGPDSGPVTLSELIPHVSIDEVAGAVAESLRMRLGGEWGQACDGESNNGELRPTEDEAALRLEAERYGRDTWTWRR